MVVEYGWKRRDGNEEAWNVEDEEDEDEVPEQLRPRGSRGRQQLRMRCLQNVRFTKFR